MFPCQLLVWSQLAASEGFGGITYCLADSKFGVSHESVGQVKTAGIQRSTYIFCLRVLCFMLITFLYHVILIILQSDWRCQHSDRAHNYARRQIRACRQTLKTRMAREIRSAHALHFPGSRTHQPQLRHLPLPLPLLFLLFLVPFLSSSFTSSSSSSSSSSS